MNMVWKARKFIGDGLRVVAQKVYPDLAYRLIGIKAHLVPGEGVVARWEGGVTSSTPGLQMFYRDEDYDHFFDPLPTPDHQTT